MKRLEIGIDFSVPLDAVTQKMAYLGRTGSGKTYAATKMAEEMLNASVQIIVLDPVGVWYGLRLLADGKSPGIPIHVFGGLNGDIPLEPTGGTIAANFIVDTGASVVLDVSQFESDAQKARFATDFSDRFFFRKKASPSAVHIFLEEAQEFIAQNPMKGEERMLHAFTRLWKLGRNFGIGGSLISQRPQEVNKKALNMTECLFAFQMTGPHERKTIESWVAEKGLDLDIVGILPKLKVGQCQVWSPQWLEINQTVKWKEKRTFNASSTPLVGGPSAKKVSLAPVDLSKLSEDMLATVERAKQNDPELLKKRIRELERERSKKAPVVDEAAISRAMQQAEAKARRESVAQVKALQATIAKFQSTMKRCAEMLTIGGAVDLPKIIVHPIPKEPPKVFKQALPANREIRRASVAVDIDGTLTNPEQRILNAIAWFESIGIDEPEQPGVAFLAGYRYGGGAFNNPRGALRTRGLVEYLGDKIKLTEEGRSLAQSPDVPLTNDALHEYVMRRLPTPEQKLLRPLLDAYPNSLSNDELANASGYVVNSGGFNNPRGRLRTLGLIEYLTGGQVKARDILFPNQ